MAAADTESEYLQRWMINSSFDEIRVKWNEPGDVFVPYEVTISILSSPIYAVLGNMMKLACLTHP